MNAILCGKTAISLIKSCTKESQLIQIQSPLLRTFLYYDPAIFHAFLSRFASPPLCDLSYSSRLFTHFPEPNVTLYNAMIKSHSLGPDESRGGLSLFRDLLRSGIVTNGYTLTLALKCSMKTESLRSGMQIHGRALRDGFSCDGLLMTTLMDLYSCLGKWDEACNVFTEISKRDVVAWNVFLSCCLRSKHKRDALGLFDYMMTNSNGCEPDEVTCLLVLQACGSLNALEFGEKVHRYITEKGLHNAVNVSNSLISMYSRCGSIEKAYDLFKQMVPRSVVTWTAIISGLASNGYGRDAIEAFNQMLQQGISPDDQTLTGVLSACSHSGLVQEGQQIFNSMARDFRITPNIHHYGCMVDLLGRAGLLDEAYNLIVSMRIKPDATMWRTLLGACRIHRNVDLGERVVEHLTELKAQEAGDHILLLNIYSSSGKLDKVVEVRKMLKEKGIRTQPASSTIELKGQIHDFFTDDVSHPRKKEVYEMLAEINHQLRIAGYVVEISSEMHHGMEVKSTVLSYHSEKLAIAFGVLETPPGTTIRVAKDLRICSDCHNFAKILSAVYNRKVIVRDRNRFHHFREGRCSCNDYW